MVGKSVFKLTLLSVALLNAGLLCAQPLAPVLLATVIGISAQDQKAPDVTVRGVNSSQFGSGVQLDIVGGDESVAVTLHAEYLKGAKAATLAISGQRGVADFTKGLVLAGALVLTPASVTAQVTDATRAKIVELQASDPGFRLKTFHRGCIDGTIQDHNCEEVLKGHIRIHTMEKEVNTKEAQLNVKEAQLEIVSKVLFDLDVSLSLLYTANYVIFDLPFPDGGETIGKILGNLDTPKDIIDILNTFKTRKDRGEKFDYNSDGKLILGAMTKYINSITIGLGKLENTKYYSTFQSSLKNAQSGYRETQRAFSRKSS